MPHTISVISWSAIQFPPTMFAPMTITDGVNTYYWCKAINTATTDTNILQPLLDAAADDIWSDASQGPALTPAQIANPDPAQAYFQSQALIIQQTTAEIAAIGNVATAGTVLNLLAAAQFNPLTTAQKLELLRGDMMEAFQDLRKLYRLTAQSLTPVNFQKAQMQQRSRQ